MYTIVAAPTHQTPMTIAAPTLIDDVTGAWELRRRLPRTLHQWELFFPGTQEKLADLMGLIKYAQGDIPIWYDGGGMLEVVKPQIIGIGNGSQIDFRLPDRHVYVASMIVYVNGGASNIWQPLGGDGVTCDKIRFGAAPGLYSQIRCKYRRKAKVAINTDSDVVQERAMRKLNDAAGNIETIKISLRELPT